MKNIDILKRKALEKDAFETFKSLARNPKRLKPKYFKVGNMLFYSYRAKHPQPYDKTPLTIILGRSRKYTLGINVHWTPPRLRKKLLEFLMSRLRKVNNEYFFDLTKKDLRLITHYFGRVIRKYINTRISRKGVIVPKEIYYKVIYLRSETFIGISAEEAWSYATKLQREKKMKRKRR